MSGAEISPIRSVGAFPTGLETCRRGRSQFIRIEGIIAEPHLWSIRLINVLSLLWKEREQVGEGRHQLPDQSNGRGPEGLADASHVQQACILQLVEHHIQKLRNGPKVVHLEEFRFCESFGQQGLVKVRRNFVQVEVLKHRAMAAYVRVLPAQARI